MLVGKIKLKIDPFRQYHKIAASFIRLTPRDIRIMILLIHCVFLLTVS